MKSSTLEEEEEQEDEQQGKKGKEEEARIEEGTQREIEELDGLYKDATELQVEDIFPAMKTDDDRGVRMSVVDAGDISATAATPPPHNASDICPKTLLKCGINQQPQRTQNKLKVQFSNRVIRTCTQMNLSPSDLAPIPINGDTGSVYGALAGGPMTPLSD
ncbi:hypothetical protein CAPTEDRAFT_187237 [Capitella teleta]|uniref:Uncharacterized protein n=1 Tax=Capitella teleta TaxID=283909 RepID=X1ZK27_CAPTE|nr:hypothetical protein CAPTEDRAFT_187237 [Capitella teleta]|eukprot:ELU10078.1 hypothetical protein CAPTEDRAFT_187237 [Capitella teleta]